jgi:hypothetical protein
MSANISVKANAGAARVTPKLKLPVDAGAARMSRILHAVAIAIEVKSCSERS